MGTWKVLEGFYARLFWQQWVRQSNVASSAMLCVLIGVAVVGVFALGLILGAWIW